MIEDLSGRQKGCLRSGEYGEAFLRLMFQLPPELRDTYKSGYWVFSLDESQTDAKPCQVTPILEDIEGEKKKNRENDKRNQ